MLLIRHVREPSAEPPNGIITVHTAELEGTSFTLFSPCSFCRVVGRVETLDEAPDRRGRYRQPVAVVALQEDPRIKTRRGDGLGRRLEAIDGEFSVQCIDLV